MSSCSSRPGALLAEAFDDLASIEGRFVELESNVDRITTFVLGVEGLIESERAILLETLGEERGAVLASVDRQRMTTGARASPLEFSRWSHVVVERADTPVQRRRGCAVR